MAKMQDEMKLFWGKGLTILSIALVSIIAVYLLLSLIFSFWPFSSAAGVVKQVTSANAIIQNYEWFYDMKAQIDATRGKYRIAKDAGMQEAPGILMVLEGMIAEYNSRSKQTTRNLWKSPDLPYEIESEVKQ